MAKDHPDTHKTRGSASCSLCGARVLVKVNRKGLLYYNCKTTDGGCGAQVQPRTAESEKLLAAQIEKWNEPDQRRAYLGDAALPAKARKTPDADPAPPPPPPPDDPPADAGDDEGDADPPPPPPNDPPPTRRRAPPKRQPPPPPQRSIYGRMFK